MILMASVTGTPGCLVPPQNLSSPFISWTRNVSTSRGWIKDGLSLSLWLTSTHPSASANSPRFDEVVLQDVPLSAYSFSLSVDCNCVFLCQIIIGLSGIICDMTEWDQGGRSYRLTVGDHNGVIYELRSLNNLLGAQSPFKHRGPVPAEMDPNVISIFILIILVMKGRATPGVTGSLNVMSGRVPWIQWFSDLVGWLRASRDGAWQSACLISLQGDIIHCRTWL